MILKLDNKLLNNLLITLFGIVMILSFLLPYKELGHIFIFLYIFYIIKNIKSPSNLLIVQILFVLQYNHYISSNILSNSISYLADIINFILLLHILLRLKTRNISKLRLNISLGIFIIYFIFMFFGLISNVLYDFNLILYIYSIRNIGRAILFFISCIIFIREIDKYYIKNLIFIFSIVNIILVIFQFYINGYKGDSVGGIFGNTQGIANVYLNVFLLIIIIYSIVRYVNNSISYIKLFAIIIYIFSIAIIAELKFIFFEVLYVLVIVAIYNKRKSILKFLFSIIFILLIMYISKNIFILMFPNFSDFFSLESIINNTSSAGGLGEHSNTIGRSNFFNFVYVDIFNYNLKHILIGIGLGNAEYSTNNNILISKFFMENYSTVYYWYSSAWMLIEVGLIGIILYLYIFIYYFNKIKLYNYYFTVQLSIIMIMCIPILFLYNTSLRLDIIYIYIYIYSLCISNLDKDNIN